MSNFSYWSSCYTAQLIFRLAARVQVRGLENLPRTGGALLLPNHISHFDGPLVGSFLPRMIHFVVSAEFFQPPWVDRYLRGCYMIPFDRTKNDRQCIKEVLRRLEASAMVGIFPERGIRFGSDSVLQGAPLPEGTTSLAQMTQVPIIPMIIVGSDQLYRKGAWLTRPRIFLQLGAPLMLDRSLNREAAQEKLRAVYPVLFQDLVQQNKIRPVELPISAQARWGQQIPS